MLKHFCFLFSSLLLLLVPKINYSQNTSVNKGVGAVSEIIVPDQTDMRSNFTLMYEVKFRREQIPVPSFWYKVVFIDTASFTFSLFPLRETDRYDFYLYKIIDNYNFCAALGENKIISCDSAKYKAAAGETGIKAALVGAKSVKVNGGDAIYIEVMSTKGWDGGHILDFKLSDNSSFIVKVENTFVDTTRTEANAANNESSFGNISNKEIQEVFCKTLSSEETLPHHLLYTRQQAIKDSIAIANKQKNKMNGAVSATNSSEDSGETKVNVKSKSALAIFNTLRNKSLSKAKNPVYLENVIPEKGVIYKIQVGFFMSKVPPISIFKGLSPIFQEKSPIGAKYFVGAYSNYELASVAKNFVRSLGMSDAFVIAYYNGKRVTVAEARSHEEENKN